MPLEGELDHILALKVTKVNVASQGSQDQTLTLKVTKVTLTLHEHLVLSHLGRGL